MNPRMFQHITTLMSVSLLGIILVQGFGIWRAYDTEVAEYHRDVQQALSDTGEQFGKLCLPNYDYLKIVIDSASENPIVNRDKQKFGLDLNVLPNSLDKEVALRDEFFEKNKDYEHLDDKNTLILPITTMNYHEEAQRLVNQYNMDSLFQKELAAQGFTIPFCYGVKIESDSGWVFLTDQSDELVLDEAISSRHAFGNTGLVFAAYSPNKTEFLIEKIRLDFVWSLLLVFLIFGSFWYALTMMRQQKELSELKTDFINNMTHEFKTPIATINFAVANLENPKIIHYPEKILGITKVIKQENQRMNRQVEQVLRAAKASKKELDLEFDEVEVHELILPLAEASKMKVEQLNGTLTVDLKALSASIKGDMFHLTNAIANLLDNAEKYSQSIPNITIGTYVEEGRLVIYVKDQGIGMTKEEQAKVFDRFYRVPTGNLHQVKGFGLGLSYVKSVVEAHQGTIRLQSMKGEGSLFEMVLPQSV